MTTPETRAPRAHWLLLVQASTVAVLVAYVVDVAIDPVVGVRSALRIVAVLGAVVAAGTTYQRWSVVPHRTIYAHVMAGAGLLGGALVASSVVSASDNVFSNVVTGALGTAALLVAAAAARLTTLEKDQK